MTQSFASSADLEDKAETLEALCMQRETLEVWARLGVGEQVAARGRHWTVGRTYYRDRESAAGGISQRL